MENEEKVICQCCGKEVENLIYIEGLDKSYCDECISNAIDEDEIFYCDDCGEYCSTDEYNYIEGENRCVCNSCFNENYYICDNCGEPVASGNEMTNEYGAPYCDECYNEIYTQCYHCDCEIVRDDCYWNDGEPYCNECVEDFEEEENNMIRGYHETRARGFHLYSSEKDTKENKLYFGFELEVDGGCGAEGVARGIDEILNTEGKTLVTFERDGSLDDDGFEIISQPMTMNYLKEQETNIKKALEYIVQSGYKSHDTNTCGLHIHFSRAYFKESEQDDIESKLTLLSEIFKHELEHFCRRNSNRYVRFLGERFGDCEMKKLSIVKQVNKNNDRYQVFNFTNRNTIEFRLPKGTLKYETFMATIQLVNNLVHFASKSEADLLCLTWEDIVTYNKTKNKELIKYCTLRNLLRTHTIVNFSSIDTLKNDKSVMKKALTKAEKKGAIVDISLGSGVVEVNRYVERG